MACCIPIELNQPARIAPVEQDIYWHARDDNSRLRAVEKKLIEPLDPSSLARRSSSLTTPVISPRGEGLIIRPPSAATTAGATASFMGFSYRAAPSQSTTLLTPTVPKCWE